MKEKTLHEEFKYIIEELGYDEITPVTAIEHCEDVALDFAAWCGENYVHSSTDNTDSWHNNLYKYFSTEELLNLYQVHLSLISSEK
jgi:hypothetical protein